MRGPMERSGRGHVALLTGLVTLGIVAGLYPFVADQLGRPLAVFALPPLLVAVVSGWKATLVVGACSLTVAVVLGVAGPLEPPALLGRWSIIAVAVAAGAAGAWYRELQQRHIEDLDEATTTLRDFERSLAPAAETSPGLHVAVRYVASERHLDLGGDFLDTVALPDGRLAFVIGDVCGHGPTEAAFGTAMRAAWRTIVLTQRSDPVEWVAQLEHMFFRRDHVDGYATVCAGVVDPRTARADVVSAGHPWPIMLGLTVAVTDIRPGAPLGLGPPGWTTTTIDVADHVMLLYSDGLVENPRLDGSAQRWEEAGLVAWLQDQTPSLHPEHLVERVMTAALHGRQLRDDVAVLAIKCGPRATTTPESGQAAMPSSSPPPGATSSGRHRRTVNPSAQGNSANADPVSHVRRRDGGDWAAR